MRLITVTSITFSGADGGSIFHGETDAAEKFKLVASSRVMPRVPVAGETWLIEGFIRKHAKYGPQVHVQKALLKQPSGRLIVSTIANSKFFPDIGKKRSQRLWDTFGESLYDLLEKGDSGPFIELLGPSRAETLSSGWKHMLEEHSVETAVYEWLDKHGVPVRLAQKLIIIYQGSDIIELLEENPYRLMAFTSWTQADTLARSMGIAKDDDRRLVAAVDAVVFNRIDDSHTWTHREAFIMLVRNRLDCSYETAQKAINVSRNVSAIVDTADGIQGYGPYSMESFIASRISEMLSGEYEAWQRTFRREPDEAFLSSFFDDYRKEFNLSLNQEQRDAVRLALSSPVGIICGGAGVGKTTVLHAIHQAAIPLDVHIEMIAYTGRAARRMSEATGHPAMTIASFLKSIDNGRIDLSGEPTIAIDESSMVDLPTMFRLLVRLEPGCKLLFLGDPGQLPPISFGIVFHALCDEKNIPCVELTEVHRQAAETGIPQASKHVRSGEIPSFTSYSGCGNGVSFIDCPIERATDVIFNVVNELGGFSNAQVICPVKRGNAGTQAINKLCHEQLAFGKPVWNGFAVGEPVIWLENNYELGLMNGSLGVVTDIDNNLVVNWDEGLIPVNDTTDMDLAYAITVHKSQGSQFSRVVIPVFDSRILDRTLIYTAITRAKYQVVLIGDRAALEKAVVEPSHINRRETALHMHLNSKLQQY